MRIAGLLIAFTTFVASAQSRTVALTVDDLPCANCSPTNVDGTSQHGFMVSTNQRLLAGFIRARIPVTGLVVTQTAEESGDTGWRSLQLWLNDGFDLGNHTYSHPDFSTLSTDQMESDIARADSTLRPLLAAKGEKLQSFRYPYNHTGDTQSKHDAMATYLKEHGYEVATCTIDTSDYVFASAYARAIGAKDQTTADRIRREYISYSGAEIDFYADLNRRVLGYEPPEVMLLHDSLLNADAVADVLALFRSRGYRFVSLTEAQQDPAYAVPDTYIMKYGPMWGYRWAQERNLGRLGMNEPEPPTWITEYPNTKPPQDQAKPGTP